MIIFKTDLLPIGFALLIKKEVSIDWELKYFDQPLLTSNSFRPACDGDGLRRNCVIF